MSTNENQTVPPQRYDSHRRDSSLGPAVGLIVAACIVFFVVNGPYNGASNRRGSTSDATFRNTAILGGIERRINSSAFRNAEASAFMGGVKLDFRDAVMEGNEARLDVQAIMGGVEIHVPRTWTVVNRVNSVLGGVEDHSRSTDSGKRLVIDGTVLMGGLEISN
jgi:predicted membrane protein